MLITKEILNQFQPGEIFWTVTTKIQYVHEPMNAELTFVCVKGKSGMDWAIYCSWKGTNPNDIARNGDKVTSERMIRAICPCDDEVFELYRQ